MNKMPCKEIPDPHSIPRGLLKHLILELLKRENLTGAAIGRILEEKSGNEWKPSPGSIYPALSSLEENGFVEKLDKRGRRKPYRITDKGLAFIKKLSEKQKAMMKNVRTGFKLLLSLMDAEDRLDFLLRRMRHITDNLLEEMNSLPNDLTPEYLIQIESIYDKLQRYIEDTKE
jgi:DNA-binding PadR family transcriptional regulator